MCVLFKLVKSGSFDPNYYKRVFLMLGTEPRTKSRLARALPRRHTHSVVYFIKNNVLTGNYGMLRMEK